MSSDLPDRPSLEYLKKQARERLRELQVRVPGTQLADAQHAIAREYGFPSWPKLKAHVDAVTASRDAVRRASATHSSSSQHGGSHSAAERALAVHLRDKHRGGLFGVALFVPSVRYAAMLIDGAGEARERKLTPAVWREIDSWVITGDLGLPAEPAPLSRTVVTALLKSERPTISAHRFASFPMKAQAAGALNSAVKRLLPRLLDTWRPSTAKPASQS
jgi:hypothetical protein